MKKILFVLPNLGGGGAERVFVNIANGFFANGIETELLLGKKAGVYFDILNPGIPVHELGTNSFLGYLKKLPPFLKKNLYSHIFTTSDYINVSLIIVKKRFHLTPLIILNQQYSNPSSTSVRFLKERFLLTVIHRFFTHRADKIITASEDGLKWLQQKTTKKLPQALVIHNPVFDDNIFIKATEKISFPFETGGKKILLNIGRLVKQKDQLTLIKAFKALPNAEGYILIILGVGPEEKLLKNVIRKMQLEQNIFLIGFDKNPYRWINNCDLFILSSVNEGFGNVIVEAMALGKTTVSTDCPTGPAEILKSGQFGFLCKVGDPDALAKIIVTAINAPISPAVLVAESWQYSAKNIIGSFINVLQ